MPEQGREGDRSGERKGTAGRRDGKTLTDGHGGWPLPDGRGSDRGGGSVGAGSDAGKAEREMLPGEGPLAYFITFHTYGTWLHGDERGSIDREHNVPGTPCAAFNETRRRQARARLRYAPLTLDTAARVVVENAIASVGQHRGWTIHALAVVSNHVHVVVSAPVVPEQVMYAFKSWATRRLVEAGALPSGAPAWVRHGSTRYLWKGHQLQAACEYVDFGQGEGR
jgi:REP element-mobilizing transposase RayT